MFETNGISFPREKHATLDETEVISHLLGQTLGSERIMLDVGAHRGHSAKHFVNNGWRIYCFEPDLDNRENHLVKRFAKASNVVIDSRAVSDNPAQEMSFFKSDESSGISALHAFHDTHREVDMVEVTTVTEIVKQHGLTHVDFLKIDVEGFDFNVLKGVPWDKIKPDVIECEYEDAKTVPMGHTWRDVAEFLRGKGYAVYLSEWHPIIRYGIPHDWRRVVPYPQMNVPAESWGNILAFRNDPGYATVQMAFENLVNTHSPAATENSAKPIAPATAEAGASGIASLHNRYKGKRCFIIGNGLSLNKHDLSLLEGEYVFGVNGIFYKTDETRFRPSFYVVEDNKVMEENIERIKAYDVPQKFFPSIYKPLHPQRENVHFFNMDRGFYDKASPYHDVPRFSTDASKVLYCGQSVTYINLQLAFYMGFTEIYLIGMDFDYVIPKEHERRGDIIVSTTDDPNHFHKDYFGKGKTWKDPKLDRVAMNYRQAKLSYEAAGRKIYNATIGGKLEVFERVDYEALLRDSATGLKRREVATSVVAMPSRQKAMSAPMSVTGILPSVSEPSRAARKWAKVKRDPRAFFRDAHFAPLRPLQYLFRPADVYRSNGVSSSIWPMSGKSFAAAKAAWETERRASEAALRRELAKVRAEAKASEKALRADMEKWRAEGATALQSEITRLAASVRAQDEAIRKELALTKDASATMQEAFKNDLTEAMSEQAEYLSARLEDLHQNASNLVRNEIVKSRKFSNYSNSSSIRLHDRQLSGDDVTHIQGNWMKLLGLSISNRQLYYIAHQICMAEERCEGRMATTIQAAMLRTLVLLSLQTQKIELLEIGSLFGIASGSLYLAGLRAQRSMKLTIIDPLEGYYKQGINDGQTGVPVTRETLVRNFAALGVGEPDYRIIQHLSTDATAVEAASERSYDYVLIDGDHSLEGVASDFELYAPMVKPGGVIIFDDYATTDWPAIQTFVDGHVRSSDDWLWIGGEWRTGILRRKRRGSVITPDAATTQTVAAE